MPDMLVKLYELKDIAPFIAKQEKTGIDIRHAIPPEKHLVLDWVKKNFSEGWQSECDVSFSNQPVSCFIAVKNNRILGFACYDATYKDYFGPTGVGKRYRGKGIGTALLLACLHAMKEQGYAYAVIGGAGPVAYYNKVAGAIPIEGSSPGIYKGMLRKKKRK